MLTENDLLSVIDAFIAKTGVNDTTISARIFDDGKRVTQLRAGAGITLRRANDALAYLSAHWPDGAEWPDNVCRPHPQPAEVAE